MDKNGESKKLASWLIEMKDKKIFQKKWKLENTLRKCLRKIICSKYLNIFEKYLSPNTK